MSNTFPQVPFIRNSFLVALFFSVIALSVMGPLSSNDFVPAGGDFPQHIGFLYQAKKAVMEGQFPIREAPNAINGWHYPLFQFYNPFMLEVGGKIAAFFDWSSWMVLKLLLWFTMTLGGVYSYRLLKLLTGSAPIGLLAGVVYILSPVNLDLIHNSGSFMEPCGMEFIPIVLYYVFRLILKNTFDLRLFLLSSLAWFILETTHFVTFAYFIFFLFIFLLVITLQNKLFFKSFLINGLSAFFSFFLSAWLLIPIILNHSSFRISELLFNPYDFNFYTKLSVLLAQGMISFPNLQFQGQILPAPSIGIPILCAIGIAIYIYSQKKEKSGLVFDQFIPALLVLFFFAFFLTWSPFNFWQYVPKIFNISQFSWRYLIPCTWIGLLIVGWALLWLFNGKLDARHVVIGVVLIVSLQHTWMQFIRIPMQYIGTETPYLQNINNNVGDGYAAAPNLISTTHLIGFDELPFTNNIHWLLLNKSYRLPSDLFKQDNNLQLTVKGLLPKDIFYEPITLSTVVNNQVIAEKNISPGEKFEWTIPIAQLLQNNIDKEFNLSFRSSQAFLDTRPVSDKKPFAIVGSSVSLSSSTPLRPQFAVLSLNEVQKYCEKIKTSTICNITVPNTVSAIQLPILYYAHMLKIKVNGKTVDYYPTLFQNYVLTAIKLKPGQYHITMKFRGLWWANWISLLSWLAIIVIFVFWGVRYCYKNIKENGKFTLSL